MQSYDFSHFRYYSFSRHWSKTLKSIIESPQAREILDRDFECYIAVKRANYIKHAISKGALPSDFDSCDWRHGRLPAWHHYVCHGACHWIANTLLYVAMTAHPNRAWRIVSSPEHSTVWDGDQTLFDINYLTLGVSIDECGAATFSHNDSVVLPVGEYLSLGHYHY